jgi:glucokinase
MVGGGYFANFGALALFGFEVAVSLLQERSLVHGALGPTFASEQSAMRRSSQNGKRYKRSASCRSRLRHALFAIAAPIHGERCVLTNSPWVIDAIELQATFGLRSQLVNDFAAVAHSLPLLGSADLANLGGGAADKPSPMAILGPGTGLGVACLIRRADKPVVIASEGGHATLAATCDREDQIIQYLRQRFGHVSAERAVSGSGLENIYLAIGALDKVETKLQNATQITRSALRGECRIAVEALNVFCAFLGSFAGNVALTFDARGGVYIAGGISPRIVKFLRRSQFRARFEAKGRFREYLKAIPVNVITHPAAAFVGLRSISRTVDGGS